MSLAPRPQLFRRVSALAFVLALSVCLFGPDRLSGRFAPKAAAASTFTINSTGDGPDSNAADGACDDGTGHCTLRAAIQQANATPGTDTINFQIPATDPGRNATTGVFTISPASALPTIIDPVVINGYSQPGAQANTLADADNAVLLVELSGSGVTAGNFGPIAQGSATGNEAIIFTATSGGALTGQKVHIANNFDNVAEQTLSISGAAYRLAAPSAHTPEPVSFGNVHVGAAATQALSITNTAANDGFSEKLDASLGGATGNATASGSFSLLGPTATNNSSRSLTGSWFWSQKSVIGMPRTSSMTK